MHKALVKKQKDNKTKQTTESGHKQITETITCLRRLTHNYCPEHHHQINITPNTKENKQLWNRINKNE